RMRALPGGPGEIFSLRRIFGVVVRSVFRQWKNTFQLASHFPTVSSRMMRRSPLVIIFLTVFIDLVGFGILLPLLPYYAESLGASSLQVGLLSTSYSLMQFLFTPVWGRLSDRYGRRPLILLSLAGSCLGFLVF